MNFLKTLSFVAYDNDFGTGERAWNPEIWAAETLAILEENMVVGNLVHTDFANEVASFGDTVNTRRPGEFVAKRKGTNDDVEVQSATAEKIPVVLNQHVHTSFMIRDGEESRSFRDLVEEYLKPAAVSLARHIDLILLGQVYQFKANAVGDAGELAIDVAASATHAKDLILDGRNSLNKNNCPMEGRNLVLTPNVETEALKLDLFISADKVGDEGTALRDASLGRKLGFDIFMCQNTPSVDAATYTEDADDIDVAVKGATTLVSDDGSAWAVGEYLYLKESDTAKDGFPYRITAISTNDLTIDTPLRVVTGANNDAFRGTTGLVSLAEHAAAGGPSAYAAGYDKEIWIDDNITPEVGQLISFATAGSPNVIIAGEYTIIAVTLDETADEHSVTLDRPLEVAITDNDVVAVGPKGEYCFAFTRNAMALVSRPLAPPKTGTGALVGVSSYNNLAMRIVITYDGVKQGHLVTLDMLCGVKVLDENQGTVLMG